MNSRPISSAERTTRVQTLMQQVGAHFSQGRNAEALAIAEQALALAPGHPDLLNMAGACAFRCGQAEAAERYWLKAVRLTPKPAALHGNLGVLFASTGRIAEAEVHYRRAVALAPDSAMAVYNLGLLLARRGDAAEAERCYRRALALNPNDANAEYNLGLLLAAAGRDTDAEQSFRRAIAITPNFADALHNLGAILLKSGCREEAEAVFRRAILLEPGNAASHHSLGLVLSHLERDAEAEDSLRRALSLQPDHVGALVALGVALARRGETAQAEAQYRRALAIDPAAVDGHYNLGLLLAARGEPEAAMQSYRAALSTNPGHLDARYNLGVLLAEIGCHDEAETCYREVLDRDSAVAQAARNLAGLLLRREQYEEGWKYFEARHSPRLPAGRVMPPKHLAFPRWEGEPLMGRSILVWLEQGLGDQIQFCRYVSRLKMQGAGRVTLVCAGPLVSTLASLDGIDAVVAPDSLHTTTPHDVWSLLESLPLHLHCADPTLGTLVPYLRAPAEHRQRWQSRIPLAEHGLRVGIAWRGSPANSDDHLRSLPSLATLAPLWSVAGVQFVSVQKGVGEAEAQRAPDHQPLLALGHEIKDMGDMAAILSSLDLVITVDTVVAHLAGALGLPTWVLLRHAPDWRWLDHCADSPWYPGVMRLFRQPAARDWDSVVGEVAKALGLRIEQR